MHAAVLAGRIAPAEADVRGNGVAELQLPAEGAELRARVCRAVDGVGPLTRLPHDIELGAIAGHARCQVETALEYVPVEKTGDGPELQPPVVVDVGGVDRAADVEACEPDTHAEGGRDAEVQVQADPGSAAAQRHRKIRSVSRRDGRRGETGQ